MLDRPLNWLLQVGTEEAASTCVEPARSSPLAAIQRHLWTTLKSPLQVQRSRTDFPVPAASSLVCESVRCARSSHCAHIIARGPRIVPISLREVLREVLDDVRLQVIVRGMRRGACAERVRSTTCCICAGARTLVQWSAHWRVIAHESQRRRRAFKNVCVVEGASHTNS